MSNIWRYLLRDNPMQMETTRAIRRLTVSGGYTAATQRTITRLLFGMLYVLYVWFLITIVSYKDDMSQGILWFEFGLLTLLIPGSLYAAISGERERLTWDSLIMTKLSPSRILVGKLLWRLSLAGIIMLILLPPLLLTHFMSRFNHAYTLPNLLWMQFLMASWCIFLAAFTVYVSAKTKRSVATLSIVALTLLTWIALLPMLISVFGVRAEIAVSPMEIAVAREQFGGEWDRMPGASFMPLAYIGSLLVHLNPGYLISAMEANQLSQMTADYWRDFMGREFINSEVWGDRHRYGDLRGPGIFELAPFIYLFGAGLCVAGTLKALARLGMPTKTARFERKERGG